MTKSHLRDKNIIVIYHGECDDGFGSAYAAWKKFGDKAAYVPTIHQVAPPLGLEGKDLYLLDFTYSEEVIRELLKVVKSITVIDHHAMMEPAAQAATNHLFNIEHSGAVLAWNYFHPGILAPLFLQYVEDGDLWRFNLPHSRALVEIFRVTPHDFKVWDAMVRECEDEKILAQWVEKGNILLEYKGRIVAKLVHSGEEVEFEGYRVRAVNTGPMFKSEVGAILAEKYPPFGILWSYRDGRVIVSLRANGAVNVAELAQRHGGGGHPNSAGFWFTATLPFPFKCVSKDSPSPQED